MAADKEIMDPFVAAVANALSDASRPSYVELNEAFTKQHFEAIAKAIKDVIKDNQPNPRFSDNAQAHAALVAVEDVASKLADIFQRDNPNFNKSRFLQACGV